VVILSVFLVYSSNIKLNQGFFCSDFVQKSAFVGKYVPNCERLSFGSLCGRPEEKSITSSMGLRTAGDSALSVMWHFLTLDGFRTHGNVSLSLSIACYSDVLADEGCFQEGVGIQSPFQTGEFSCFLHVGFN
jgi:hypothetical protein